MIRFFFKVCHFKCPCERSRICGRVRPACRASAQAGNPIPVKFKAIPPWINPSHGDCFSRSCGIVKTIITGHCEEDCSSRMTRQSHSPAKFNAIPPWVIPFTRRLPRPPWLVKTEEKCVIANFRHLPEMWQSHSHISCCLLPWVLPSHGDCFSIPGSQRQVFMFIHQKEYFNLT